MSDHNPGHESETPAQDTSGQGVNTLVASVEQKMTELMAWHGEQSRQLEADKAEFEKQVTEEKGALETDRKTADQDRGQLEKTRSELDKQREQLEKSALAVIGQKQEVEEQWAAVKKIRAAADTLASELEAEHTRSFGKPAQASQPDASDQTESSDQPEKPTTPLVAVTTLADDRPNQNQQKKSRRAKQRARHAA